MTAYNKTRYPGVTFKEVSTRTHKGKPDRYFLIRYGREGRTVNEGVGFSSEGIDAKYASTVRSDIVKNIRQCLKVFVIIKTLQSFSLNLETLKMAHQMS
ncbi:hypothetical protein OAT06_05130 [Nitrospinaceae bacterium]|nr:hypothetical protein [Nitrospinaceae bacterium]